MTNDHSNFRVTDKAGNVIAQLAISAHIGGFVAHVLPEYCELWIDHDNLTGDYKPASWYVSVEGDIGVPVWRRLSLDDAYRRAAWHADQQAKQQNITTLAGLATFRRSVSERIVAATERQIGPPR